jgi:hypothetical protein
MTTLSTAGKARRLLEFMLGLRDDRVLRLLESRGFSASDHEQGWQLLRNLGMTRSVPVASSGNGALETAIESWRLEWTRIARVSLARSFPELCDALFRASKKKDQTPLVLLLRFLDRLEKLQSARDTNSRAALAKLASRGLTSERIAEGRALVDQLKRPALPAVPNANQRRSAIKKAEDALWAYYIEWSEIARAVIKDRRLLDVLGYGEKAAPHEVMPAPAVGDQTAADTATRPAAKTSTRRTSKRTKPAQRRKG